VQLGFAAPGLPNGGYYYAVLALRPYRHFTRTVTPACSASSDMQRTDYGYPQPDGQVALTLGPSKSDTGHWCRGGSYDGAVYAVPHTPPCENRYPCSRSEPYEPYAPCAGVGPGCVEGVIPLPVEWGYPDPPPVPLDSGTKTVARFSLKFPARIVRVLHLAATVYDIRETSGFVSSHESVSERGRHVGDDFSACVPEPKETAHCTGKYALQGGTIRFAGTIALPSLSQTLTITGGTGRYRGAEGGVLTEYSVDRSHAKETITFER
jgi:hypothetical protein